jgi:DNA-binding transcriptional ArsR family regulator
MSAPELDRLFAALADPTRRAIIARLASGQATVTELVEPFGLAQPSVSKHLKVLERAGLISRGRAAQTRPCMLEPEPLRRIDEWVGAYRRLWEDRFDRLDSFLKSSESPRKRGKVHGRK